MFVGYFWQNPAVISKTLQEEAQLDGLLIQECGMDDAVLRMIGGKRLFSVKSVQLTGNYFTHKGILDITKSIKGNEELR